MSKMGINLTGTIAKTDLGKLNILLNQDKVLANISDRGDWNILIHEMFMESIFCRAVDIFQDCLLKHVSEIISSLDIHNPLLTAIITQKKKEELLISENPKDSIEKYLLNAISYSPSKLRKYAMDLGFQMTCGVELIIITRNYIVHRNGLIDESYLRFTEPERRCSHPVIDDDNKIRLDPMYTKWSIEKMIEVIGDNEGVLNELYSIKWHYMDTSDLEKPLKFNKWKKENLHAVMTEKFSAIINRLF
jgi:hypothetical protein